MLHRITPVILTRDEAPNIRRTLARLGWARDIVVVDSGSTDGVLEILGEFPQARVFHRPFDSHGGQWRFAIGETAIATDWVLRLDADYLVTPELERELAGLDPGAPASAYRIRFDYAMFGQPLRASLYPSNTVLFRRGRATVYDDGHTERWRIDGPVADLRGRLVHDDRKSMSHWIGAQARYMARELPRLKSSPRGVKRWLRLSPPLMPFAVFLYCLFGKGLILGGRAGMAYALQRLAAETMLALMVLEDAAAPPDAGRPAEEPPRASGPPA